MADHVFGKYCLLAVAVLVLVHGRLDGADDEPASPATCLFDTGVASAPLHATQAWTRLPEDETAHRFRGDAVLRNDKLARSRAKAAGLEVFSVTPAGYEPRAMVVPLLADGSVPAALSSVRILENNPGAVLLEAIFQAGDGAKLSLACQLAAGQGILEFRPAGGVARLRLQAPSRYVVIPDFFGHDMVFTPDPVLPERITLPAENFFLTPLERGRAMLMCVWASSRQAAEAIQTPQHGFAGCELECVGGKSVWLALLEGQGLWYEQPLAADDLKAKFALPWKPPFPAKWRADLVGPAGAGRSWYFLGGSDGEDASLSLADGRCPCRFEGDRAVVDWPAAAEAAGGWPTPRPLLVYPMDRSRTTPLTAFCPTDVLRNTLGVGPCQYILQTEGLQSDTNPTPDNVMTWIEKQIARKRQKKAADEIRDLLKQMTEHARHADDRIQRYAGLGRDVQGLCAEGEVSGPLRTAAATLKPIAQDVQRRATPPDVSAAPQRVSELAAQVAALIDQTDPLAECQRLGSELRSVGAVQDRALASARMSARWLRARAQMLAAGDPSVAGWTRKVQELVDATLQDKR